MTNSPKDKIAAAVGSVLGENSPFLQPVVDHLSEELATVAEQAAVLAEKKWLANLGAAQVIGALAVTARPAKRKKEHAPSTPPPLPIQEAAWEGK